MQEHEFAQYVRILGKGRKASRSLDFEEAQKAMQIILRGEVEDIQLGAFLMLLRIKEESPEELAGFALAVREFIKRPKENGFDLDWPSYAGKRGGQSLYILSMILLGENNLSVICHGSLGHTHNRLYTQTVFEALKLPIANSIEHALELRQTEKLVYLPLANFCQTLEDIMHMRNLFGLRSPVHSFSKLINPCHAKAMLIPTFHPSYKPVHQLAAVQLNEQEVSVFKGDNGEAQRRPQAILDVDRLKAGQQEKDKWPSLLETRTGDDSQPDIQSLIEIWRKESNDEFTEQAIIGTTALALNTCNAALSQQECLEAAEQMWRDKNRNLL